MESCAFILTSTTSLTLSLSLSLSLSRSDFIQSQRQTDI